MTEPSPTFSPLDELDFILSALRAIPELALAGSDNDTDMHQVNSDHFASLMHVVLERQEYFLGQARINKEVA